MSQPHSRDPFSVWVLWPRCCRCLSPASRKQPRLTRSLNSTYSTRDKE